MPEALIKPNFRPGPVATERLPALNAPMRVLFLYNSDRAHEARGFEQGLAPSHRLFGLLEMKRLGHQPRMCPRPAAIYNLTRRPMCWRIYQAFYAALQQRSYDAIIATHELAALPLLVMRRFGLLRKPVLVISVALLHSRNLRGIRRALWRAFLPAADVIVTYASAQVQWHAEEFNLDKRGIEYVPFGIDTGYFPEDATPDVKANDAELNALSSAECLAVGTNAGKDFVTLVTALPKHIRLTVVTDVANARLIRDCGADAVVEGRVKTLSDVPIDRLRDLYRRARVSVLPLREAKYSSGQTVLLENMALGKAVIVTRTSAVLDYIEDGVTAIGVDPGNVEQMRLRIEEIMRDPKEFGDIGRNAARRVREFFSAERTASRMLEILSRFQ